jgi:hypothetical protein
MTALYVQNNCQDLSVSIDFLPESASSPWNDVQAKKKIVAGFDIVGLWRNKKSRGDWRRLMMSRNDDNKN